MRAVRAGRTSDSSRGTRWITTFRERTNHETEQADDDEQHVLGHLRFSFACTDGRAPGGDVCAAARAGRNGAADQGTQVAILTAVAGAFTEPPAELSYR